VRNTAAALAAIVIAGCASGPPAPGGFHFAVMGDTPYNEREERAFVAMIERVNREPVDFVIHVGDIKGGGNSPCTDELYRTRRAQFDRSAHPFIYTPGDNEWTDCRRRSNGAMDPLERLAKLREVFFASSESLGTSHIATRMQSACLAPPVAGCGCGAYPENRLWTHAGVTFVTLNVPGDDDNTGHEAASDAEAKCRFEANRRWLDEAVRTAGAPDQRALAIAIQADLFENSAPRAYAPLRAAIVAAAARLNKPVLFIHGDTHIYRVDTPFTGADGFPVQAITRLETYGSPFVGWVDVTYDPGDPQLFRFAPHLEALELR
jgi:hypothetical protein